MNTIKKEESINKPIFIVGAGHSGTSILTKALAKHPDIEPWPENNKVWIWGNVFKNTDLLTEKDLTTEIKSRIRKKFIKYAEKTKARRVCDKTPKNCIRIPFVLGVFPDAKIIHVVRDGRAVVSSTNNQINKKSYSFWRKVRVRLKGLSVSDLYVFLPRINFVLRKLLGLPTKYWGSKPPGWQEWSDFPPYVKLAKQWSETISIAIQQGRAVSPDNYLEIHYEDFIEKPEAIILQIAKFIEVDDPQPIVDFCNEKIDTSRNKKRINSLSKENIALINQIIEPTLVQLGYK